MILWNHSTFQMHTGAPSFTVQLRRHLKAAMSLMVSLAVPKGIRYYHYIYISLNLSMRLTRTCAKGQAEAKNIGLY